ncbi:hypothetical protein BaRGS_00029331 [Batillaria attramentaria]|uniref:Uncharacterized protein n=1 Tax=Batillaria attramentaria TaxID=370345 RepID=A0ABD0JXI5_9CAEN
MEDTHATASEDGATNMYSSSALQELDAKWEARFGKLESAITGLASKISHTAAGTKRAREPSPTKPSADDKESDDSDAEPAIGRSKGKDKQPEKKAHVASESDSDGEIIDDDAALSVTCEEDDDDLLKELAGEIDNVEPTSENVAASMADIINKRFRNNLADDKLKSKLDAYARPANCEALVVPTVNPEIWKVMPPAAKKADLKLAMTQRAIVKASVAIAQSTQQVIRAHAQKRFTDKPAKDEMTKKAADSFALLGHACTQLSLRQRHALNSYLPKHLAGLCSSTVPITSQLFGDDLHAVLLAITGPAIMVMSPRTKMRRYRKRMSEAQRAAARERNRLQQAECRKKWSPARRQQEQRKNTGNHQTDTAEEKKGQKDRKFVFGFTCIFHLTGCWKGDEKSDPSTPIYTEKKKCSDSKTFQ